MADITKTQIKKRAQAIVDKLQEVVDLIQELKDETEQEAESVEPYEGKEELTPQQEERQEWLTETADTLDTQADAAADIIAELENINF